MKTKESSLSKLVNLEKLNAPTLPEANATKPKSLRPMRSMVAVRSLKPKTAVATMIVKNEELNQRD